MKRRTVQTIVATALAMILVGVWTTAWAADGDAKAGKEKYDTLCFVCHGTSGKGDGVAAAGLPVKPRDHTNGDYMNAQSNQRLFDVIKKGGPAVGLDKNMPPWGGSLSDQEIKNIIAYIRSLAVPKYEPKK